MRQVLVGAARGVVTIQPKPAQTLGTAQAAAQQLSELGMRGTHRFEGVGLAAQQARKGVVAVGAATASIAEARQLLQPALVASLEVPVNPQAITGPELLRNPSEMARDKEAQDQQAKGEDLVDEVVTFAEID
jgi:hypothetical protein